MRKTKNGLNEGLADDISSRLLYSFFIDMYPIVNRRGGLLTIMFPNVGSKKLSRWLKGAEGSDLYTQNAQRMEEIYRKMSAVSSLKTLYRAVNVLKSKETPQAENETRINDLNLLMSKIERVIKAHLSNEDKQLFNSISSLLSPAANDAAKSIEGSVGASTQAPEEPVAEPTEEPEQSTEEPTEEPAAEPKQQEKQPPVEPEEEPTEEPAQQQAPAPAKPAPKEAPAQPAPAKPAPAKPEPKEAPEKEEAPEEESGKNEAVRMRKYLKAIIREIVERKLGLR